MSTTWNEQARTTHPHPEGERARHDERQPALRILPIPESAPPPVLWRYPPEPPSGYVQGTLAVDFRSTGEDEVFGPQATATQDLPDPGPWVRRMLQAIIESMAGARSAGQLTRWLSAEVHENVARRCAVAKRRRARQLRPVAVRSVHVCQPDDGVAEVSAVVAHNGRVRAVALRMVGVDRRWLITALQVG